jgi:hypothetical protein
MAVVKSYVGHIENWLAQDERIRRVRSRWLDHNSIGAGIFLFLMKGQL